MVYSTKIYQKESLYKRMADDEYEVANENWGYLGVPNLELIRQKCLIEGPARVGEAMNEISWEFGSEAKKKKRNFFLLFPIGIYILLGFCWVYILG